MSMTHEHDRTRGDTFADLAPGVLHEVRSPLQFLGDSTHFLHEAFDDVLGVVRAAADVRKAHADGGDLNVAVDALQKAEMVADPEGLAEDVPDAFEQIRQGLSQITQMVDAIGEYFGSGDGTGVVDLADGLRTAAQLAHNRMKYYASVEVSSDAVVIARGDRREVLHALVQLCTAVGDRCRDLHADAGDTVVGIATVMEGGAPAVRIDVTGGAVEGQDPGEIGEALCPLLSRLTEVKLLARSRPNGWGLTLRFTPVEPVQSEESK